MPLTYAYADAYLKAQVTEDRETRAGEFVDSISADFSADWKEKLTILRAYILVCLECQAQPDDLFAQKLKHYRQEWDTAISSAKASLEDADGNPAALPAFTFTMERA